MAHKLNLNLFHMQTSTSVAGYALFINKMLLCFNVLMMGFLLNLVTSLFSFAATTNNVANTVQPTLTVPVNSPLIVPIKPRVSQNLEVSPRKGRMSFYFQNIEIRMLLQLIAKTSGLNFIISDAVKGNVTLRLNNVTWQQALTMILRSHSLGQIRNGDTIFISTIEDLVSNETKELQSKQDIANLSSLSSTIIRFKYTDAVAMAALLKGPQGSLLTQRGEVVVDTRSNSLVVKDTNRNLAMIRRTLRRLDVRTKQVSIEARIVNIDTSYEEQLGVRFGISNTRSLSGTLSAANQLRQGIDVADVNPVTSRLNFNLPANALSSGAVPASIGLALARLGPILLDLELSALEEEGHSQIISRPRVVAANSQKAYIMTGEEIPYQESTSSGATSIAFKKAVLSLEIVPQITADNKINLKLKATQDTRGQQLIIAAVVPTSSGSTTTTTGATSTSSATTAGAVFGPPTINTQQVEATILLNDNETVALGGIYRTTKTNTLDRVPFFGSIPYVGALFRHKGSKDETTELLIFITPRIVNASLKGIPNDIALEQKPLCN